MPARKNLSDLFSLTQAAKYLGMSRQGVWEAIQKGSIKARKIGNTFVVHRNALDKYKSSPKPPGGRPRKSKNTPYHTPLYLAKGASSALPPQRDFHHATIIQSTATRPWKGVKIMGDIVQLKKRKSKKGEIVASSVSSCDVYQTSRTLVKPLSCAS